MIMKILVAAALPFLAAVCVAAPAARLDVYETPGDPKPWRLESWMDKLPPCDRFVVPPNSAMTVEFGTVSVKPKPPSAR